MNSAVLAAVIGVTGTVIIGVAGFGASIWNARANFRATQEARLREQRTDVYLDALASLAHGSLQRDVEMRGDSIAAETLKTAKEYLGSYIPPNPYKMEARLMAFASAEVQAASVKSYEASLDAWAHFRSLGKAADAVTVQMAAESMQALRKAADDADRIVINLIRRELQGDGPAMQEVDVFAATEPR